MGKNRYWMVNIWRTIWHCCSLSPKDNHFQVYQAADCTILHCQYSSFWNLTSNSNSSNGSSGQPKRDSKRLRQFKLYSLATFRMRPHKLLLDRCSGTVNDIVRRLTVKLQKEILHTHKDNVRIPYFDSSIKNTL